MVPCGGKTLRALRIMTEFTPFTDEELLRRVGAMATLTPLELELTSRLQRALDEVEALESEVKRDPRSESQGRDQEAA